tara:strand:- start:606 stop:1001 length:396 start_codon:yes stop_codon:yes gene_type:complete
MQMKKDLLTDFIAYHNRNPDIYRLFIKYAGEVSGAGRSNYSARIIIERIRWHMAVETKSIDEFKINDHHVPFYARMFMYDHPEMENFFELRCAQWENEFMQWLDMDRRDQLGFVFKATKSRTALPGGNAEG